MCKFIVLQIFLLQLVPFITSRAPHFYSSKVDCGPYGFVCDGISRLRICDEGNLFGPGFLCPSNTVCNEESEQVCENVVNYIDPVLTRNVRCYRNERIADPSVPGCKGYIMCIPNKNRFQGVKFQCSGKTIFNGYTRACTSPEKYKCPLGNSTTTKSKYNFMGNGKIEANKGNVLTSFGARRPIECENYKFAVTDDQGPVRVTHFCPPRPAKGETTIRCTLFSNNFCVSLERDDEDQFLAGIGSANRRPRTN